MQIVSNIKTDTRSGNYENITVDHFSKLTSFLGLFCDQLSDVLQKLIYDFLSINTLTGNGFMKGTAEIVTRAFHYFMFYFM